VAFFAGYIPNVTEPPLADLYSRQKVQLWRLEGARARDRGGVALYLAGRDILDGYRRLGFYALGTGGVRWFRNPVLTDPFDRFLLWAPDDGVDVFTPRRREHFALEHGDEILAALRPQKRWFLFINCLETHAPYDLGTAPLPAPAWRVMERARAIWGGKDTLLEGSGLDHAQLASLHPYQIQALEGLDERLGRLVGRLPRPFLFVFCGDHGECFGEGMKFGHGFVAPQVLEVPLVIGVCR
jgi:hypothetical protein